MHLVLTFTPCLALPPPHPTHKFSFPSPFPSPHTLHLLSWIGIIGLVVFGVTVSGLPNSWLTLMLGGPSPLPARQRACPLTRVNEDWYWWVLPRGHLGVTITWTRACVITSYSLACRWREVEREERNIILLNLTFLNWVIRLGFANNAVLVAVIIVHRVRRVKEYPEFSSPLLVWLCPEEFVQRKVSVWSQCFVVSDLKSKHNCDLWIQWQQSSNNINNVKFI